MERRDSPASGAKAHREAGRRFRAFDIMSWLMSGVVILFILLAFFCLCAVYAWFLHKDDAAQSMEPGVEAAVDADGQMYRGEAGRAAAGETGG